jgi:glucokinase
MEPALIGDIGATNARFGLLHGNEPTEVRVLEVAAHKSLGAAIRVYLDGLAKKGLQLPKRGALAVAGPITGDSLSFTNHPWSFSINELATELGFGRLDVVNDFVALALAVPHLSSGGLRQIGPGAAAADAPIAVIGPGTGLGVSIVIPIETGGVTRWMPIATEGGHVTLSPVTARESAIVQWLHRSGRTHVSAEILISGQGLSTLYAALAALDGIVAPSLQPAEVTGRMIDGNDPIATEAVEIFCALLGTVAGNLALSAGARGGVYIAGGIVPRLGDFFDRSEFRARFVAKGRMQTYLDPIPTFVITEQLPAFVGLAALLLG